MNTAPAARLPRQFLFRATPLFAMLALSLLPATVCAQKSTTERLIAMEKEIDKQRVAAGIPGIALVIVQGDQIIYLKGIGLRDVAAKKPVTPDTLFPIGSSTKAFTAAAVLMSQDDGKLSLEDSPKKVLPYFKLQDAEADKNITIRDLLCHDSGLARTDYAWIGGFLTREEGIRVLADVKPTAPFRKKFQYQNLMFSAAGEIAARVQKMPYEQMIESRIFKPLGMTNSNLSVKRMEKSADFATGYALDPVHPGSQVVPIRDIAAVAPAGAINSSARDMAQWLRFLLNRGVAPGGKRLLSESGFAEVVKPQMAILPKTMDYGLGWFIRKWNGLTLWEHGGNIDGFNAEVALLPEKKLGFVLLTNVTVSPLAQESLNIVWSNLVDLPPDETPVVPVTTADAPVVASETEAGTYTLAGSPFPLTVAYAKNALTLSVPGQPTYPLERLTGRRYKLGSPCPDGFFITFRPVKDKPAETEASLEQPNGTFLLKKNTGTPSPFVSPLSIDALLAKMVTAAGGEETLRRHKTLAIKSHAVLENQGLTATIETVAEYPNRREQQTTLIALEKKAVGKIRDYFDGTQGGVETNFSRNAAFEGDSLDNISLQCYLHPVLDAGNVFAKLEITGKKTRNGEEMLVLEKTPEKGSRITEYVSLKSFLVLRRDYATPSQAHVELYEDYRPVDGEMLPFKITTSTAALGLQIETVLSARFNAPVPKNAFLSAANEKETVRPAPK